VPDTVTPPAKLNNKLLIIIGSAIVVLLAIIAIAVSSQAIRAGQEADAKASAAASVSASAKAVADAQRSIEDEAAKALQEAEKACHLEVTMEHPTARIKSTESIPKGFNGYQTDGMYTDKALYGNEIPMQYVCSTTNASNGASWTAKLTALGSQ
jgi:hypothetical protein